MIDHQRLETAEKEAALKLVLESDTFARADQLKKFLRYVCEMESAGRAADITEYLVGVEALGRPKDFSPTDDTSVRNRAYALRHKLEVFYTKERPDAPVRIEFQKGTYIPRFVKAEPEIAAVWPNHTFEAINAEALPVAEVMPAPPPMTGRSRWQLPVYAGAILLVGLLSGVGIEKMLSARPAARIDPVIREAWGPLLDPLSNDLICVATAPQLTLLPFDVTMEGRFSVPTLEAPPAVIPWYLRYHHIAPGQHLYMNANVNSPHFGDVLGALTAAQTLTMGGVPFQFLPERLVPSAALSARNVMLFGVPHTSDAAATLVEGGRFQFLYDAQLKDEYLAETVPGEKRPRRFVPRRDDRDERIEAFGLITVRPSPGDISGSHRTVIFSGDPSAAAAAALQYFSSVPYLNELKARFKKEGYATFPSFYQVVVRCKLDSNTPTAFAYETHAVIR
jgi:hypothetical protein